MRSWCLDWRSPGIGRNYIPATVVPLLQAALKYMYPAAVTSGRSTNLIYALLLPLHCRYVYLQRWITRQCQMRKTKNGQKNTVYLGFLSRILLTATTLARRHPYSHCITYTPLYVTKSTYRQVGNTSYSWLSGQQWFILKNVLVILKLPQLIK